MAFHKYVSGYLKIGRWNCGICMLCIVPQKSSRSFPETDSGLPNETVTRVSQSDYLLLLSQESAIVLF